MTDPNTCPDCAVKPGEPHEDGCDVARCLVTGGQRLQCVGRAYAHRGLDEHVCGTEVWTGECATEDLNRLAHDAKWNRQQGRWVLH